MTAVSQLNDRHRAGLEAGRINLGKIIVHAYNISLDAKGRASTQAACTKPNFIGSF